MNNKDFVKIRLDSVEKKLSEIKKTLEEINKKYSQIMVEENDANKTKRE